jgi:RecA-family ATPase
MSSAASLPTAFEIARALGGQIRPSGDIAFAGPGRAARDRSCSCRIDPDGPDGFIVTDGRRKIAAHVLKDFVRAKIGVPFVPRGKNGSTHHVAESNEARGEPSNGSRKGEGGAQKLCLPQLTCYDADALLARPAPERRWHVPLLIPANDVGIIGADGGEGKTTLGLQAANCTRLGFPWIGHEIRAGAAIYLSAEEPIDELHYRLEKTSRAIAFEGKPPHSLTLISCADTDATLATFPNGIIQPTGLFHVLTKLVAEKEARLLVLDAAADVFGGNEIDRSHVRAFIRLLRSLAITNDCAVLLLSHPSVDGMKTGRGYSGSTHWNNAVRSRFYLTTPTANGSEADPDLRELALVKANRGPRGTKIMLRWRDGHFVVERGAGAADAMVLIQAKNVFLELLQELNAQGRRVSPHRSPGYAPKIFSEHPNSKGIALKIFARAMDVLFAEKRLKVQREGSPARSRDCIVEVPQT